MSVKSRIFAVLGIMTLTGCPYTEGCEALTDAAPGQLTEDGQAPLDDAGEDEGGKAKDSGPGYIPDLDGGGIPTDSGFTEPAAIDFGVDPGGGPTLSTVTCPALDMPAQAATVYVDASAAGAEAGTKAAPFRTVAKAFASAMSQGIIWVAAGTYKESLVIPNKALLVQGGFTAGFGARTNACATILEATNVNQPVLSASDAVKSFSMEGLSVQKGARGLVVDGDSVLPPVFTIARSVFADNGKTTDVSGAVGLDNVHARIFGNVFRDNRASKGAAIGGSGNVTLIIDQNVFDRNLGYADHGGALYLSTKSAKIDRNTFRANRTGVTNRDGWGGAVIVYKNGTQAAKADFSFNVFTENVAGIGGALFVDDGATVTMAHDLLYRNRAYPENGFLRGPALYADGTGVGPAGGSTLIGEYLTVSDNAYDDLGNLGTPTFGGNVYVEGFSKASFTNSIFWNNGDNAFYVEAQNELSIANTISATTCTSSDGMGFIAASATICKMGVGVFLPPAIQFVDQVAADYHEKSTAGHFTKSGWILDTVTSPAIDKADPAAPVGTEPSPNGARANLGAFAGTKEASKTP
jgi:hypothetical protein